MTCAYALGIAPGVQALVLVPITIGLGHDTELTNTAGMALGWAVSLVVAEHSVRASSRPSDGAGRSEAASATMSAVVYDRYGGPEELHVAEVSRPVVGPGEIVVRVEASGVNALDRRMLRAEASVSSEISRTTASARSPRMHARPPLRSLRGPRASKPSRPPLCRSRAAPRSRPCVIVRVCARGSACSCGARAAAWARASSRSPRPTART
jgi:hypothetical protein